MLALHLNPRYVYVCIVSGVLWEGSDPIDGAATVLNALRSLGKRIFLVTNNSQLTRAELQSKAAAFGHHVQEVFAIIDPGIQPQTLTAISHPSPH